MKTVVITSGYFNPIHPWHIECLELCKELWDELWVIVNNDLQAKLKTWKNEVFQDEDFRMKIIFNCPNLIKLNKKIVSEKERKEANELLNGKLTIEVLEKRVKENKVKSQ